jgi:hypothetical protein
MAVRVEFRQKNPDATRFPSVMNRYEHPRNIRVSAAVAPLKVNEDYVQHCPPFLPHDGLGIASDKILGKLFL